MSMSIRGKIIVFQGFFIFIALIILALAGFAILRVDYFIHRVQIAYKQLETITDLPLRENRYAEQIAEMLLFGQEGREEFEEARRDLEISFTLLRQITVEEVELVKTEEEKEEESQELDAIQEMRVLTDHMHATALDLLDLKMNGREDEAYSRYRTEIEEGLDDELQRLVDLAIIDEAEEVREVDERVEFLMRDLIILIGVVALVAIGASVGAVRLLGRAVSEPITRLAQGAEAVGRGELGHRIAVEGQDELAQLSRHFNKMAGALEEHQRKLLEYQRSLEQKVSERTAQLEEANRQLKDLDRLRVLFLADISHELRTPLTVLRGEAEVTLRNHSSTPDDYRETLEQIVQQAANMGRLVDDLLFLTRAEADSIRFDRGVVCLQEVLDEAMAEGRVLAWTSGITLEPDFPAEPLEVVGDPQRLRQTAVIAVDNAIKYSHDNTSIDVILRATDADAVMIIRNRGGGIPSEDLPYVFDRFYRARHNLTKATGGSGLGLSIAKWIVEKHGGTIILSNQPCGTTELEIHLPRR
jgi:two-component system, OmpR family, sensor kinase